MTFDEWHKAQGNGRSVLHRATGISYAVLRKVEERVPVRWDTAHKLAAFLGCDPQVFVTPKPRRKRKAKA